ncbi:MAG: hypothetical protein BWX81_00149 [Spirochaetes bacterium ADurb.Bin110]|nr:MAG: hypothetical protein BWX81_00149 [Spirochaetes bacterium ADurb.Bin110]
MKTRIIKSLLFLIMTTLFLFSKSSIWAQSSSSSSNLKPPEVIDENELFGGPKDIVTVIDPNVASAGTVQLVEDTKTYPVFLISGSAGAGLYGNYTPLGGSSSDKQTLYGAVDISDLEFDYLPAKNLHFSLSTNLLAVPNQILAASATAYADLRQSDLVRLYVSGSFNYDPSSYLSTNKEYESPTFSLDELFVDTHIEETLFFRLGKQRISWGVGNWFKPSDVLSLSAIDPDDPTAAREGPFAFKVDVPMKLNHLMVYIVPPISENNAASSSAASKYDLVVNGWELSFGAYARADMLARPRAIFSFTGAIGSFDVYGENVLLYGSDRIYARESSTPGTYEAYSIENKPFFQSTLGVKYSKSYSGGLSYSIHVQGYYNGMGYADSSIMQNAAATAAITEAIEDDYPTAYRYSDSSTDAGMWYLAGSASVSGRFGEGNSLTRVTGSVYALANFSDGSLRFNPQLKVQVGDEGGKVSFTISDLTSIGDVGSEYAKNGNITTPALTVSLLNSQVSLQASVPIKLNADYSVKKVQTKFSILWNAIEF